GGFWRPRSQTRAERIPRRAVAGLGRGRLRRGSSGLAGTPAGRVRAVPGFFLFLPRLGELVFDALPLRLGLSALELALELLFLALHGFELGPEPGKLLGRFLLLSEQCGAFGLRLLLRVGPEHGHADAAHHER